MVGTLHEPPPTVHADDRSRGAAAIELAGVVASSDGFPVLTGVDLRVERGETLLVSGANGAGKTSLLRLVAGLLRVARGTATVLGHDLALDRRAHQDRVALIRHETGCYDDLTVRRNLRLHGRMSGADPAHVETVIEQLGLAEVAEVPHGRLSTGQRRRCALALGLVRSVELLLLDEPHAGLDAQGRDVVDRVVASSRAAGTTVLLVSHELDRARQLADREVVLTDGYVSNANFS